MKKWTYFWCPVKDLDSLGPVPWEVVAIPPGQCDADGNSLALMMQEFGGD